MKFATLLTPSSVYMSRTPYVVDMLSRIFSLANNDNIVLQSTQDRVSKLNIEFMNFHKGIETEPCT